MERLDGLVHETTALDSGTVARLDGIMVRLHMGSHDEVITLLVEGASSLLRGDDLPPLDVTTVEAEDGSVAAYHCRHPAIRGAGESPESAAVSLAKELASEIARACDGHRREALDVALDEVRRFLERRYLPAS